MSMIAGTLGPFRRAALTTVNAHPGAVAKMVRKSERRGGNRMIANDIAALERRVDNAEVVDAALLQESAEALRATFPDLPDPPGDRADPTDAALWLIDRCLPGWSIMLHGTATEPDGHWRCHLRRSESRDDDAVIGHGTAPGVGLALLRALVSVASQRH
jgi:hypothetical protein